MASCCPLNSCNCFSKSLFFEGLVPGLGPRVGLALFFDAFWRTNDVVVCLGLIEPVGFELVVLVVELGRSLRPRWDS